MQLIHPSRDDRFARNHPAVDDDAVAAEQLAERDRPSLDPAVGPDDPHVSAALGRGIDGRQGNRHGVGHGVGAAHGDRARHAGRDGVAHGIDPPQGERHGESRGVGRGFGVLLEHGVETHVAVGVEHHAEAGGRVAQDTQAALGHGELHGRGARRDQPHDGFARLHPLVVVRIGLLDHSGEGRHKARFGQRVLRIAVLRAGLRIARLRRDSHDSLDEFAVLYRTNAQSRRLEESLRKRNISYRIYGGLSFYQRKEVKDAIAYFRLATNPDDDEALRRVINYPARGIGETTVAKLIHTAMEHRVSIWKVLDDPAAYELPVNSATLKKLDLFRQLVADFNTADERGTDAYELATTIISRTRLLSSLISDNTPESISKQENLQEILSNVKDFVDEKNEAGELDHTRMQDFLAEVSLATDQDEQDTAEQRVTLMTAHAAKGLEFNNVIVVGVEEELFPSAMASGSLGEIEEERRLLYVAVTRAKKFCMLSYASSRFKNGQTKICQPSRFLRDIDPRYLKPVQGTNLGTGGPNPYEKYRSSFHSPIATHAEINPKAGVTPPPVAASSRWQPSAIAAKENSAQLSSGEFALHTLDEVASGMEIMHERFGRGKITDIDPDPASAKIVVLFSNVEQRKLMLKYAKFKIL